MSPSEVRPASDDAPRCELWPGTLFWRIDGYEGVEGGREEWMSPRAAPVRRALGVRESSSELERRQLRYIKA